MVLRYPSSAAKKNRGKYGLRVSGSVPVKGGHKEYGDLQLTAPISGTLVKRLRAFDDDQASAYPDA